MSRTEYYLWLYTWAVIACAIVFAVSLHVRM